MSKYEETNDNVHIWKTSYVLVPFGFLPVAHLLQQLHLTVPTVVLLPRRRHGEPRPGEAARVDRLPDGLLLAVERRRRRGRDAAAAAALARDSVLEGLALLTQDLIRKCNRLFQVQRGRVTGKSHIRTRFRAT